MYIILIKEHLNRLTEKDSQLCSFLCLVISQDLNIKKVLNIWSACMDERCKDNVLKTDALKAKWTGSYFILCAVCHVMPERSADTSVRGSHDLSGFNLMEICYLSVVILGHMYTTIQTFWVLDGFVFKRKEGEGGLKPKMLNSSVQVIYVWRISLWCIVLNS